MPELDHDGVPATGPGNPGDPEGQESLGHHPAAPAAGGRDFPVPRMAVCLASIALIGASALVGGPLGVWAALFGGAALVAGLLAGSRSSVVSQLAPGLVVWCALVVALWQAGFAPVPGRTWTGWSWWFLLGAAGGLAVLVSRRMERRIPLITTDEVPAVGLAAALLVFGAVVSVARPFEVWSRNFFLGTDFTRHIGMVARAATGQDSRDASYPRGFHMLVAWALGPAGADSQLRDVWVATAAGVWFLAAVALVGLCVACARLVRLSGAGALAVWATCVIGTVVYLQTAWFDRMLSEGYVVNYLAAVALLATGLAIVDQERWRTSYALLVGGAALVVSLYSWQFLAPVVGWALLVGVIRARRDRMWWLSLVATAVVGVALGLPTLAPATRASAAAGGSAAVTSGPSSVADWLNAPVATGLGPPDWWWAVGCALALYLLALGWIRGHRQWAIAQAGMVAFAVVVLAWMFLRSNSSWIFIRYYPAKFLWTTLILVIPLSAAGLVVGYGRVWRMTSRLRSPTIPRALVLGAAVLGLLAWAGWESATDPRLRRIAEQGLGVPAFNVAMVESLNRSGAISADAIVFGLVPNASVADIDAGVGVIDGIAMESLKWTGVKLGEGAQAKVAVSRRDLAHICLWLRDHPGASVVTGPNPRAGIPWLADAGCPESAIRASRWIVADVGPEWFDGIRPAGVRDYYASYEEYMKSQGASPSPAASPGPAAPGTTG